MKNSPLRFGLALAFIVVVLDQLTKWWIVERVMQPPAIIDVTPFFNLVLVLNRGVSFGMFNNDSPYNSVVLTVLSLGVAIMLAMWLRKTPEWGLRTALGMIIGGAVGNSVDRIHHNGVVDFLDVHIGAWHWPAFNVADSAISVGAALMIADALFRKTPENDT